MMPRRTFIFTFPNRTEFENFKNSNRIIIDLMDHDQSETLYTTAGNGRHHLVPSPTNYEINALVGSVAMLLLCIMGLYSNLLSFLIFKHKRMRSSINVLLAALSLIDFAVVCLAIPVFVLPTLNEWLHFEWIESHYYFVILFLYPLAMMAQTSSIWTFILITIERFYAVCHPLNTKMRLTTKRAKLMQIAVIIGAVLYNIVRFWEYRPNYKNQGLDILPPTFINESLTASNFKLTNNKAVDQITPLLRESSAAYFHYYYVGAYLITHCVVPFFLVLALNARIIYCIRKSGKERSLITNGHQTPMFNSPIGHCQTTNSSLLFSSARERRFNTTKMVFVVTALFFLCNLLSPILNIWEASQPDLFDYILHQNGQKSNSGLSDSVVENVSNASDASNNSTEYAKTSGAFLLLDLSNIGVLINVSTNFIVYLIYCRRYRRQFKIYVRLGCCWSNKMNIVDKSRVVSWSNGYTIIGQTPTKRLYLQANVPSLVKRQVHLTPRVKGRAPKRECSITTI